MTQDRDEFSDDDQPPPLVSHESSEEFVDEAVWTRPMTRREREETHGTRSEDEDVLMRIMLEESEAPARRTAAANEVRRRRGW